jgi:hypothetical protein
MAVGKSELRMVAFLKEFRRLVDSEPEAREQLRAGSHVAINRIARFLRSHPHPTQQEIHDCSRAVWEAGERAMRFIARRQQQRRMTRVNAPAHAWPTATKAPGTPLGDRWVGVAR